MARCVRASNGEWYIIPQKHFRMDGAVVDFLAEGAWVPEELQGRYVRVHVEVLER